MTVDLIEYSDYNSKKILTFRGFKANLSKDSDAKLQGLRETHASQLPKRRWIQKT